MKRAGFYIRLILFICFFFLLMGLVGSAGVLEGAEDLPPQETITAPAQISKEASEEMPATLEPLAGEEMPATLEPLAGEEMKELPKDGEVPEKLAKPLGDELATEEEGGLFRELADNALYSVKTWGTAFPSSFPKGNIADDADLKFMTRLAMESNTMINERLAFQMELLGTYSTGEDELRGTFGKPGSTARKGRILEARRAFVRLEEDDYDVVIGKALVPVGLSNLFIPSNRYELADAAEPTRVETMGVWQINVNYYIEDDKLSYTFMPYHERSSSPDGLSRWLGSSGDPTFFSLPSTVTTTSPGGGTQAPEERFWSIGDVKSWGHLLHYKGVRSGYDFFALAHFGPSAYPVVKDENSKFFKENPLALTVAGGVSATVEAWNLYSEASYQLTNDNKDQDFLKYVLGASYRETKFAGKIGLEEIFPILEYAGEVLTDVQKKNDYVVDSQEARPGHNTLLFKIDFRQNDDFTYQFFWTRNLTTIDEMLGGMVEYRYDDSLTFQLIGTNFTGQDNTQFGRWNDNDYIQLQVHYKF